NVEYGKASPSLKLPLTQMNCERPGDLQVGRREPRISFRIARPQVLAIFVLYRPWETGMDVPHGHDGQLPRSFDVTPDEESIWRVKRKPSTCVLLNDGLGIIAEEQGRVIQGPICSGVHIRTVQQEASTAIARRSLELTIRVITTIRESNNAGVARAFRRYDEVPGCIAVFVSYANAETVRELSRQFHIPCSAARVLQASRDPIGIRCRARHLA